MTAATTSPLYAISNSFGGVRISWDMPEGTWDALRLVRNNAGAPLDETDGDILVTLARVDSPTSGAWQDASLTQGRYYYYSLFTRTGTDWTKVNDVTVLAARDFTNTRTMYDRLPEWIKSEDYQAVNLPVLDEEETFLFRFLSVFGFEFDQIRSEIETLLKLRDARYVNQIMLPALAQQVGVDYEPELGSTVMRRFTANAIHLWSLKGTLPGVRELANVIMGYPAHVRIGRNLALDGLDAAPTTDKGRWRGSMNCSVAYRARTVLDVLPIDAGGVRLITPTTHGTLVATTRNGPDEDMWMQYAIPVIAGLPFTVSQYLRRTGGATGVTHSTLTWLDATGTPLSTLTGDAVALNDDWSTRLFVTATAPVGARYLEPGFDVVDAIADEVIEHCGLLVSETNTLDDWQCARELLVYLDATMVNHVGNTSGGSGTSVGWPENVNVAISDEFGTYLTRDAADPLNADIVEPLDALLVEVPGDVAPVEEVPTSPAALAETISWYAPSLQLVEEGQAWTSIVEVIKPSGDDPGVVRTARVGFRLFDGPDFIGYVWSGSVVLNPDSFTEIKHELLVPANTPYDRIEFAVSTDGSCGFRHAALVNAPARAAFYFDGATPSKTGDFLWEGEAFVSPTYYYPRRAARTIRLKALLADYLPHGACYDVRFAVPIIPDSPRSSAGADYDPLEVPPPTVGTRLRLRWSVLA